MGKRLVATLAAIAVLVVAGLWLFGRREPREVRIGSLPIIASLPIYIAQERQLFASGNIRARTITFSSSNDMVNALVADEVDVLPAVSLVPIVHLEIQDPGRVRVFSHSRMNSANALDKILVKDASKIRTLADLKGRRVGVFPGTAPMKMVKTFLRKHGVDPESVSFVQLPAAAQLSSLESGAVDALFAYEPVTTTALAHGGYRMLFGSVYADLLEPNPIGVSVIARDFERRHPKLAAGTLRALGQALEYMRNHSDEARSLLPKFTRIPPEIAARVNLADTTLTNQVDVQNLQAFVDLLYQSGEIPRKIDAQRLVAPTQ
ncbi:MAG TPA: ABC transporter substrate-binding protein [Terriglobales bacterium]|nr:ABC transporter substrate-binding protein [Terriglobales bacterium]